MIIIMATMHSIMAIITTRTRTTTHRRADMRMRRSLKSSPAPGGWKRGLSAIVAVGAAALLRRHPGAGVRAGAGTVLDRRRIDLRDGRSAPP